MKILLVAPKDISLPVGIAHISAFLKYAGHDVDCHYYDTPENLFRLLKHGYDFLGTGGMTMHFNQLKEITAIARERNTKIIVGGNIVTSEPELMSRGLGVHYSVIGEGEDTIIELLKCIEKDGDPSRVPGIGYFKDGNFILTENRKPSTDINSLPLPDYDSFVDLNRRFSSIKLTEETFWWDVFDQPREYPVVAGRSCPFSCSFCYHHGQYRQRSIDSVMKELETVVPRHHINIVSMVDDLFSVNKKRMYEFCDRFKKFRASIPWEVKWFCAMRVDTIDRNMLAEMQKSGCYLVSYGFESYSPKILKSMKKHITPQQIHNAVHATLGEHITIQANFIFGDKAETLETARETLDFWKEHIEAGINLGFIYPFPDSEMYRHCIQKGIIKDKLDFVSNDLFKIINMTEMAEEEFSKLKLMVKKSLEKFPRIIAIKASRRRVTIRCPYCQAISEYKNCAYPLFFSHLWMFCRNCHMRISVDSRIGRLTQGPFAQSLRTTLRTFTHGRIWKLADSHFFSSLRMTLRSSRIAQNCIYKLIHSAYKSLRYD